MAKKRKITPQHLAALRAAGRKRRGKKRGPYKTPNKTQIDKILNPMKLITDYVPYDPLAGMREKAVEAAIKVYLNDEGRNGSTTSLPFLKFVDDIFNYIKSGIIPATAPLVTALVTETTKV